MPKKIVIIEDEPILLKALNIELLGAGFQAISATSGDSGFDLIVKEKPDAVLLDLVLPKISGFDILEKVKHDPSLQNIPIIVLSNLGQKEEQKEALRLGAIDYFIKSNTNLEQIVEKLQKIFENVSTETL